MKIKLLFIVGVVFMLVNLTGFFIPLFSFMETQCYQDTKVSPLYSKVEARLFNAEESDLAFVERVTDRVHNNMEKRWDNTSVPFFENYVLYGAKFILPSKFAEYEYCDYRKALRRGFGLCSQYAMIMSAILEENNIEVGIVDTGNHVLTYAGIDNEIYICDAYRNEFKKAPENIEGDWFGGIKEYAPQKYIIEIVAYWIKWLLPLGLFILWFILRRIYENNKCEHK